MYGPFSAPFPRIIKKITKWETGINFSTKHSNIECFNQLIDVNFFFFQLEDSISPKNNEAKLLPRHTRATKKMRFEHTHVFVQCDSKTRIPLIER